MKKKKGFTLIELLVVIAIIAMLLAILMPALGKVKRLAQRLVCGTNLKGMANAMNVYAFDYDDRYPVAGGSGTTIWTETTPEWANVNYDWNQQDDNVSVSASLYMLVREADTGVKSFLCPSSDEKEFINHTPDDIVELWDFGGPGDEKDQEPSKCQSYSYHMPYGYEGESQHQRPVDGTSPPSNAVMADKNPWFDSKLIVSDLDSITRDNYQQYVSLINWQEHASTYQQQVGNAQAHGREGQNVLFNDGHVSFEKRPDVGTRYDNIYTQQYAQGDDKDDRRKGIEHSQIGSLYPKNMKDSVLVNDDEAQDQ